MPQDLALAPGQIAVGDVFGEPAPDLGREVARPACTARMACSSSLRAAPLRMYDQAPALSALQLVMDGAGYGGHLIMAAPLPLP